MKFESKGIIEWLKTEDARKSIFDEITKQAKKEGMPPNLYIYTQLHRIDASVKMIDQYKLYQSQQCSISAKKPRQKKWANILAEELKASYSSFPKAWESIPDDHEPLNIDGYRVWRDLDADKLHAAGSSGDDEIKRESFRTGYFSKNK